MKDILLISDLDGTLLTSSHQISEENVAAIRKFEEQGGLFTLATGRTEQAVAIYIEQLNLRTPLILYNGAKIYCPLTHTILYEKTIVIEQSFWDYLMSQLSDELVLLVYRNGEVYTPHRSELLERHERKDGVVCKDFPDGTEDQSITKLLLIANTPSDLLKIEQKAEEVGLIAEIVYSERNYLEILPFQASKGHSLLELLQLLPNKNLSTFAVGDNLNDLTLIREANHGYAVENAHPLLKTHANNITVHHDEHAIAEIINELMIEKGIKC